MKKLLYSLAVALVSVMTLCSFTVQQNFKNTDYNQSIFLYSDGTLVAHVSGSRISGTYNLENGKIYITWSDGSSQQGTFRSLNGNIHSIYVEGVNYAAEKTKNVVPRR